MYVKRNTDAHWDFCIFDPSQMVISFSPLRPHFFGVVQNCAHFTEHSTYVYYYYYYYYCLLSYFHETLIIYTSTLILLNLSVISNIKKSSPKIFCNCRHKNNIFLQNLCIYLYSIYTNNFTILDIKIHNKYYYCYFRFLLPLIMHYANRTKRRDRTVSIVVVVVIIIIIIDYYRQQPWWIM